MFIYVHKKARTILCYICFEVFDYLSFKYVSKAHASWRERHCFTLEGF